MKKLTAVLLSTLLLLSMLVFNGCEKSSDTDFGVIEIEVISPNAADDVPDTLTVGDSIAVVAKLTGFTFEYSKVNYYFGSNPTPAGVFTKEMITDLAAEQEKDAEFEFKVSTNGLVEGTVLLTVEAVGNSLANFIVEIPMIAVLPTADDTSLDFVFTSPSDYTEYKIGDKIEVELSMEGNLTLYDNLSAYLNTSEEPIYSSNTADVVKEFSFDTESLASGSYVISVQLTTKDAKFVVKDLHFTLIEYIPTFTKVGDAGYELKSIIQTYDNGYLTVSSYPTNGTKVVKYDKEGNLLWTKDISASVGIAESVCEDTEYDKGYVMAGWRQNGTHKDTWIRKINMDDGSLVWNKNYGYDVIDDGATVIKKSNDDGYIIGGYTYNIFGTDTLEVPWGVDSALVTDKYCLATGYDVRLLKIYSNGNEVWGDNVTYTSHKAWRDLTAHMEMIDNFKHPFLLTTGDQYITDLIVSDDGLIQITGWNNYRLYFNDGTAKKDMFYAVCDQFGGFLNTLTWSRLSSYDLYDSRTNETAYLGENLGYLVPYVYFSAVDYLIQPLGDYDDDELGFGLVKSNGGFGGDVVIAGETNQIDDGPVKAKLQDAWVLEYLFDGDEDGALWENSFGEVSKNDKAFGIDNTKDGGYIITGYKTETDKNTWLFKLDDKLSLIWSKTLPAASGDDFGVKVLQTNDGGYIIGGNSGVGTGIRSRLVKVNKTGDQPVK